MKGLIKIGKNTDRHVSILESLGYEVERDDDVGVVKVEVNEFIRGTTEDPVVIPADVEKQKDFFRDIVNRKAAFTYKTKFRFPGSSKLLWAIPACQQLGTMGCLVMKPPHQAKPAAKAVSIGVSDLM